MKISHVLAWAFLTLTSPCFGQGVALTFDDLPLNGDLPPGVTRVQITKETLAVLQEHKGPQVFGFVNSKRLEEHQDGVDALKLWVAAGERVGNHTYSHMDLHQNTAEAFQRDIAQNEPVLELLSEQQDWHWLRYPFLREGDTLEKRRAVRAYLHDHGYKIAEVTLDYEDYLWNSAYAHCEATHDARSIEWLTSSYMSIASGYIDGNREMAKLVFGHDINHVLLLHLGAFSSAIVPQLLDLLKQKGLHLITLEEAQSDPVYRADPDAPSRYGGSLLEQWMDVKKLPYPKLEAKPYKQLQDICREQTRQH